MHAVSLYTGVVVCHPLFAHQVMLGLGEALQQTIAPDTEVVGLRLVQQSSHTLVMFEVALSDQGNELLDATKLAVKSAHPVVSRGSEARPWREHRLHMAKQYRRNPRWREAMAKIRGIEADNALWLPEISIAMISNDDAKARATYDAYMARWNPKPA